MTADRGIKHPTLEAVKEWLWLQSVSDFNLAKFDSTTPLIDNDPTTFKGAPYATHTLMGDRGKRFHVVSYGSSGYDELNSIEPSILWRVTLPGIARPIKYVRVVTDKFKNISRAACLKKNPLSTLNISETNFNINPAALLKGIAYFAGLIDLLHIRGVVLGTDISAQTLEVYKGEKGMHVVEFSRFPSARVPDVNSKDSEKGKDIISFMRLVQELIKKNKSIQARNITIDNLDFKSCVGFITGEEFVGALREYALFSNR